MESHEARPPEKGSGWSAFFRNLTIGVIVTVLVAPFFGEDAFSFILASIVCTAGLGLAIWIPVWVAIGAVLSYVFSNPFR